MCLFKIGLKLGVPDESPTVCSLSKLDFTYLTTWQQWRKTLSLERNMNISGTLQYQISQSYSITLFELDYVLNWSQLFFIPQHVF